MKVATGLVSTATLRNWKKLSVDFSVPKLKSRANKLLSDKYRIPTGYISDISNHKTIKMIADYISVQKIPIDIAVNSLCLNLLRVKDIVDAKFTTQKKTIQGFIQELNLNSDKDLLDVSLPKNEFDIVGAIYQSILLEGEKNKRGSYFTPQAVIDSLIKDISLDENQTILDPCCGSGSFLLKFDTPNPQNIYGFDIDNLAIIIAKTNLIIKYKDFDFMPNVYHSDFLLQNTDTLSDNRFVTCRFDYIISNPPWGAKGTAVYQKHFPSITSSELFSFFLVKSQGYLKPNGQLKFVLPESILNIRIHQDIRKFILSNCTICKINLYGNCFEGVVTRAVGLSLRHGNCNCGNVAVEEKNVLSYVSYTNFTPTCFNLSESAQIQLLQKIYSRPYSTLIGSIWGLGIVTGDNKSKLKLQKENCSYLPILTGKEIKPFVCNEPKNYFIYDRNHLQQVAKDEIYSAPEKLLYKFISDKLVFAYDNQQYYSLNSANILIPKIDGMSIKTVLAFLNSDLMQFVYKKRFNQIKILKNNLCELPFPIIDKALNLRLESMADDMINNNYVMPELNAEIYKIFNLTDKEIELVERSISTHGKTVGVAESAHRKANN